MNEETTIRKVIEAFHAELPTASIYVVDNGSSDRTGEEARQTLRELGSAGMVQLVSRRGKSNAVRWAFRHVEADIYVMVDADMTYSAADVKKLIAPVERNEADMVVGDRISGGNYDRQNERKFHQAGNRMVVSAINWLFGCRLNDIMSGYRAFSRQFVKNCPILQEGFELETEITLHALDRRFRVLEAPVAYGARPPGSRSKLNTFLDGARVGRTIIWIFKQYRPMAFFGFFSLVFLVLALAAGAFPVYDFIMYRYVYRVPMAILSIGLMIFSIVSLSIGLILDTISTYQKTLFEKQMLDYWG